jgi:hypothetical protein
MLLLAGAFFFVVFLGTDGSTFKSGRAGGFDVVGVCMVGSPEFTFP